MKQVTLFTRPGCTLCRSALYVIERVRRRRQFDLDIVDISATGNERWNDLYKYDIPIIHIDGQEVFRHHVDERRLVMLLSAPPGNATGPDVRDVR